MSKKIDHPSWKGLKKAYGKNISDHMREIGAKGNRTQKRARKIASKK